MIKQFFKNIEQFFSIFLFEWIKPLTINLYEVAVNIVFTIATSVLNLAFDILYILNPSFYTTEETEEEQITNKKIGFRK